MRLDRKFAWIAAATFALALAPACGGSKSNNNNNTPDAAGAGVHGAHHQYVINKVLVPMNSMMYGFDLDGNGTTDNHLGQLVGALSSVGGASFNVQDTVDTEINSGAIILLADVQATSLTNATGAGFQIFLGANPSTPPCDMSMPPQCGKQFDGMTSFSIAMNSPMNAMVAGQIASGKFTGGPGNLPLSLSLIAGSAPINVTLIGARAEIDSVSATGLMMGKLGGGISQSDLNNQVIPAVATAISNTVAMDCSAGGSDGGGAGGATDGGAGGTCSCNSTGAQLQQIFDTNMDCKVTQSEVENNSFIQSALTTDVTINGTKAMSLGVGFTAVPATFQ